MSANRKAQQSSILSFFSPKHNKTTPLQLPSHQTTSINHNLDLINLNELNEKTNKSVKRELHSSGISGSENTPEKKPKRKRVILSSDEEDNSDTLTINNVPKSDADVMLESQTSDKFDDKCETPGKSKNSEAQSLGESFMNSYTYDESATLKSEKANKSFAEDSFVKTPKKGSDQISSALEEHSFPHLDFKFIKPQFIKDAKGHSPDDPNYDQTTLYVPESFLRDQSPGHRQWWQIKSAHFDTILFFKVGKFYELYHMDAVIAVANLNLVYMRGNIAHCGFPEIAYGRFSDILVSRGYKIARVEQTETPSQKVERCKQTMVKENVVRREICRITTSATRTYGIQEGTDSRDDLLDGAVDSFPNWLMAIKEGDGRPCFGICFVDCTVGDFKLGQFVDDKSLSTLRSLFAHYYPTQLLLPKGVQNSATSGLCKNMLANVQKEYIIPKTQFLTATAALSMISEKHYLGSDVSNWPSVLKNIVADPKATVPIPSDTSKLVLSAFGAILWYLKQCMIDVDLVTMRKFSAYIPLPLNTVNLDSVLSKQFWKNKLMVLDGIALQNLHVLPSSFLTQKRHKSHADKGIPEVSLFAMVCNCRTGFGKRLMRHWVTAPICDLDEIEKRQKAIEWLMRPDAAEFVAEAESILKSIPDLERLFQRIHVIGLKYRAEQHPDGRAQLFEADKYNKRKIKDLLIALDGLEKIQLLVTAFQHHCDFKEYTLPPKLLELSLGPKFPEMKKDLSHFQKAFDRDRCLAKGSIVPKKGVYPEFDEQIEEVSHWESKLNDYLEEQKIKLKNQSIKFISSGKSRYIMEVPENIKMSSTYELVSKRKGFCRYSSSKLTELVECLADSEQRRDKLIAEATRIVFEDFDKRKCKWATAVSNIAIFDCLLSLAKYASNSSQEMCFPEFITGSSNKPFLKIIKGFHPCLIGSSSKVKTQNEHLDINYIPNNCIIGNTEPEIMLLTGPNMGGKSTYMRQVSSLVILAQIGSMVPAEEMRLTPVDRIFCRIGASDHLSAGQSTFYIELLETNIILKQATRNSLVIIDELGRGTSTHDGTAVACAVLRRIADGIRSRTLFSTHYHALCNIIGKHSNIRLAHMACMVENATSEDVTMENITFLYTLAHGLCDKSYGFYTARMAGINPEIVRKAYSVAALLDSKPEAPIEDKTEVESG